MIGAVATLHTACVELGQSPASSFVALTAAAEATLLALQVRWEVRIVAAMSDVQVA